MRPGAGIHSIGTSMPRFFAAAWKLRARRARRPSRPLMIAGRSRPLPNTKSHTAAPISSCEKPTTMSTGVGVRSHISTIGMWEASRRRRLCGECTTPTMAMPAGRRP
jgi:hypothetical protein